MESQDDSYNSLPYIDDVSIENEADLHQYNLKIFENYLDKNRNIEITNRLSNDAMTSLSPVAPLADETEFSDSKLSDSWREVMSQKTAKKIVSKESGTKLVIKGWNSSISIQGLDNKSFITFKRRCDVSKKGKTNEERKNKPKSEENKPTEKSIKGKWKMLTKSIVLAKSTRFERRGLDERYPKYVLLKNEEEEMTKVKENYPKMFVFDEKSSKSKQNLESKSEFSFKKSFKNKTEPVVPLEEILAKTEATQVRQSRPKSKKILKNQKKPLTERNTKVTSEYVVQRRKSAAFEAKTGLPTSNDSNITGCSLPHRQIYDEIQEIFEDTLKLLPQGPEVQQSEESQQSPQKRVVEYCASVPPRFRQLSCHDSYFCRPSNYVPVYNSSKKHMYRSPNSQTAPSQNKEVVADEQNASDGDIDLENLPFGFLSSFFPRVVIMNTMRNDDLGRENELGFKSKTEEPESEEREVKLKTSETLEVPKQDLTLKSKMVQETLKPESGDFLLCDDSSKKLSSLEEDQKTKSQESEATEYLLYTESAPPENESVEHYNSAPPLRYEIKEREDKALSPVDKFTIEDINENSENLSLTKIGYKMYDNLTKLSLNHEKKLTKKLEVKGCGCNGNGTKTSPYNITLESNNSIVKVTVPENELNFQIINSDRGDIQIGVMSGKKEKEEAEKKIVRREELWHSDEGRGLRSEKSVQVKKNSKAFQTFKVSLNEDKELILSIETNDESKKEQKSEVKSTKEMKVGTDDFDLAGGDFVCSLGGNYRNLSPRVGQLLKHLHEKLDTDERERKFLNEKINQKLIDQKFQGGILPGVFLVKHISPRTKKLSEVSSLKKMPKGIQSCERDGQLREYYCEECLATMRIFEDENPSVKSMVDKFETIIQLESY